MTLHRYLLKLLERPTTTLTFRAKQGRFAGDCYYDPEHWPILVVDIEVDANNRPTVQYVIHELLHAMFGPLMAGFMDDEIEEAAILGVEKFMWEYVKKSKTRLAKWESLIDEKLGTATRPDVSLVEQVTR